LPLALLRSEKLSHPVACRLSPVKMDDADFDFFFKVFET
jgi:hypothetical protein